MLDRVSTLVVGRTSKWIVIAVWVVVGAALGSLQPRLSAATENDAATFLPSSAESTEALRVLEERFASTGGTPALLVGDPDAVRRDAPAAARVIVSRDGGTAYALVQVEGATVEELTAEVDELRAGTDALVTGPAALLVDTVEVFAEIDVTLLLATSALILVLLVAIYRSPFVALAPLVVVALAYAVAAGLLYLLVEAAGLTVNGQATGILIVLMFGAGTDYCLLLVARYREELRHEQDAQVAMAHALRGTAPAILSSGATVVAAMLTLLLADLRSTATIGSAAAIGIAVTVVVGLTLLPALLLTVGRRAFWPRVPRVGERARRGRRGWERLAAVVRRRPVAILALTLPLLAVAALGNAVDLRGLSFGDGLRGDPESVRGLERLEQGFPPGTLAPADVVVPAAGAAQAEQVLRRTDGIVSVRRVGTSGDGQLARLQATLAADPYGDEAVATIDRARERLADTGLSSALVGGPSAEEADTRATVRGDFLRIAPTALALTLVILVLLLRALVTPLYLVASQVLTFATALGISYAAFEWLFDAPGSDASLPTYVFIFIVALGIDYTIFLMARVREELERRGHDDAVSAGVVSTGGVITSAGVILAGTFAILMVLPLEQLFQLGFAIAVGVLVDTLVVRTFVVPATAHLLGARSWWPRVRAQRVIT